MAERFDYYQILGLDEDAPAEAVKRAYRARVRACHPDRYPDDAEAADRFKGVTEAYEVLSDPARRQQYDLLRRPPYNAFGRFPTASAFNRPARTASSPREASRPTLRIRLSFEQALYGGRASVHLPDGRTAHLHVPRGVHDGATVRLKGKTDTEKVPLFVTFHVAPSERFRREGNDLHVTESLCALDALLGTTHTLSDAYGREVTFDIPPGTQPGARFRLPGHGIATTQGTGDLIVELVVHVPDLSDEQREHLRAAAKAAGLR